MLVSGCDASLEGGATRCGLSVLNCEVDLDSIGGVFMLGFAVVGLIFSHLLSLILEGGSLLLVFIKSQ